MRYDAVLLDVGGTLISPRISFGDVYAKVLRPLGVQADPEELENAVRASWDAMNHRLPPGADRYRLHPEGEEGYWREFAAGALGRVLGRRPDAAWLQEVTRRLRDAFFDPSAWRVHEDVPPALDALKRAGVRLAVVSNWDSRLPALLERLGLAGYFDAWAVSSKVGVEKPHPGLFLHALRQLGVPPERALHVGDVPELDAEGARAAGVESLIVDRDGDGAPGTIRSLLEIPARLRGESP